MLSESPNNVDLDDNRRRCQLQTTQVVWSLEALSIFDRDSNIKIACVPCSIHILEARDTEQNISKIDSFNFFGFQSVPESPSVVRTDSQYPEIEELLILR
jgi:hypothetical protein